MYFTDRGIEELDKRRGDEEVTLAWVAERLQEFTDTYPEFETRRRAVRHLAGPPRRPRRRVAEIPQLRYAPDLDHLDHRTVAPELRGAWSPDRVTIRRPNGGVAPSAAKRTVRTGTRA